MEKIKHGGEQMPKDQTERIINDAESIKKEESQPNWEQTSLELLNMDEKSRTDFFENFFENTEDSDEMISMVKEVFEDKWLQPTENAKERVEKEKEVEKSLKEYISTISNQFEGKYKDANEKFKPVIIKDLVELNDYFIGPKPPNDADVSPRDIDDEICAPYKESLMANNPTWDAINKMIDARFKILEDKVVNEMLPDLADWDYEVTPAKQSVNEIASQIKNYLIWNANREMLDKSGNGNNPFKHLLDIARQGGAYFSMFIDQEDDGNPDCEVKVIAFLPDKEHYKKRNQEE